MNITALQIIFLTGFMFPVLFTIAHTVLACAKAITLTGYAGINFSLANKINHPFFLLFQKTASSFILTNSFRFSACSLPKHTNFQTAKYFSGGFQNGVLQNQKIISASISYTKL